MADITIENIPDDLYEAIKASAEVNRRSINDEIVASLERLFLPKRLTVEDKLSMIRRLRACVHPIDFSPEDIKHAINNGRA